MKTILSHALIICLLLPTTLFAKEKYYLLNGFITVPNSSIARVEDAGIRAHTNYKIYTPYHHLFGATATPSGETPASMACIYGLTRFVPGCPVNRTSALPTGGSGTIALVDAYDNPNAEADLNIFSAQFGLPPCTTANGCFRKIYATGVQPPFDPGWAIEEALDIEWAHAMAPNAKIILVEAATENDPDLFHAEDVASALVAADGGGQVSNSWGENEFAGQSIFDAHFQTPTVVYLVSSGDSGAPANFPATSPYVISAGGTSLVRTNGQFVGETAWSFDPVRKWGGTGGPSAFVPRPAFQNSVQRIVGHARGNPDISFNANPETGVSIYAASAGGWLTVGGTSVSSPALAGIINAANRHARSSTEELNFIYTQAIKNYHSYWHDIIKGNNGFPALAGYDFTTGLGSPLGYGGK